MKTYWMSFATDEGSRGVVIMDAESEEHAVTRANEMRLNPGGEIAILECPTDAESQQEIAKLGKHRLISPQELFAEGGKKFGELEPELQEVVANEARIVCEECNE